MIAPKRLSTVGQTSEPTDGWAGILKASVLQHPGVPVQSIQKIIPIVVSRSIPSMLTHLLPSVPLIPTVGSR